MHQLPDLNDMKIVRLLRGLPDFIIEGFLAEIRQNESSCAASLRRWLHGSHCHIDTHVLIVSRHRFHAGISSALYHGTYILNSHGQFVLGDNSHLGAFCYVNACYGRVVIGNHVAIGPGTKIFSYSNYYRHASNVTDEKITADVTIGNNVFIGANCVVLPGSRIGDNVVVGAGSVVKGALIDDAVFAGAPCRVIREGWYTRDSAVTRNDMHPPCDTAV